MVSSSSAGADSCDVLGDESLYVCAFGGCRHRYSCCSYCVGDPRAFDQYMRWLQLLTVHVLSGASGEDSDTNYVSQMPGDDSSDSGMHLNLGLRPVQFGTAVKCDFVSSHTMSWLDVQACALTGDAAAMAAGSSGKASVDVAGAAVAEPGPNANVAVQARRFPLIWLTTWAAQVGKP